MILFGFILSFPVFSQQNLEGRSINRGKIYTTSADTVEGQYMVFMKDSIEYYLENNQTRHTIGLNQVSKVEEYNGNYGTTGIWVGTLVGAGIGLAITLGNESSSSNLPGIISDEELTSNVLTILLSLGIGGGLGYLIGQAIEDWNTVYSSGSAFLKNFHIKLNNHNGLAVSYKVYF